VAAKKTAESYKGSSKRWGQKDKEECPEYFFSTLLSNGVDPEVHGKPSLKKIQQVVFTSVQMLATNKGKIQ